MTIKEQVLAMIDERFKELVDSINLELIENREITFKFKCISEVMAELSKLNNKIQELKE